LRDVQVRARDDLAFDATAHDDLVCDQLTDDGAVRADRHVPIDEQGAFDLAIDLNRSARANGAFDDGATTEDGRLCCGSCFLSEHRGLQESSERFTG
jgi:hypothetical protein